MKLALGTVQFGMNYGINSIGGKVNFNEVVDIINYARNHDIDLLNYIQMQPSDHYHHLQQYRKQYLYQMHF